MDNEKTFMRANIAINFQNDAKYDKGFKKRNYNNVKESATPAGIKSVADALLPLLDGDTVASIELIKHESIDL